MLNYEDLLAELQPMEKALKDAAAGAVRQQKALQKNTDAGNLAEAKKSLAALREQVRLLQELTEAVAGTLEGFDVREYFSGGDFTRQLLDACWDRNVDVKGEKGVYEMFPYKVRVLGDEEHPGEVWIDRKKLPSCRPAFVAETIRAGQAKLYGATFRADVFMNDLALAYETTCLRSNARLGSNQALAKVYKSLVPMARSRKDYDAQAFAFDLSRLYEAGPERWITKTGVRFTFGTSRDGSTGIRVLSRGGTESYISTIRSLNGSEA
ncbi:MAG: hypothetical protein IJU29_08860 [Oscillospiraceae bacterium]|nr:hypothetical protein [Oscillospiraceae bacterium]